MHSFEVHIKGLTRRELKRRRRQSHQQARSARAFQVFWGRLSGVSQVLIGGVILVASLSAFQWASDYADYLSVPTAVVSGGAFRGKNVIVLQDISSSMGATEVARLNILIGQVKAAGISVPTPAKTNGPGFAITGTSENSLKVLESALKTNPTADTIFVFSDFTLITAGWDDHDEAGYRRLKELLAPHRRRLYLGTVNEQPPPELISIATNSGGGVLEIK